MKRAVVAGAGGLIGRELLPRLAAAGYEVVRLVREHRAAAVSAPSPREVLWDPARAGEWARQIDGAAAVVNLAGAPIADRRWSAARKKTLIESRLRTTRALVDAIASSAVKPGVFVNASAIGFYGPRDGDGPLDETAAPGRGFLPDLCREWERQARKAESAGVRTVMLRTGVVLTPKGGALAKMLPPFRAALGGPLGSGRQVLSWIHLEDEVRAILRAVEDPGLSGPLNLTAPTPVSMGEFARALGRALGRPAVFPVPAFLLRALLGELSGMLLTGQDVRPRRLEEAGFRFRFPDLESALSDLLGRRSNSP